MKWSWKIARIAGIDVSIHATFFLLLAWVGHYYWKTFGTLTAVLDGIVYILALFSCVVLHEFGHALTGRRYGVVTRNILLLPIGGIAMMDKLPENPVHEIKVALAGPAVNIVIAAILWLWLQLNNIHVTEEQLLATGGPFAFRLMVVNLFLAVFNLLPAFPMDGGRVLRAALATKMSHARATEKAAAIGQYFALMFGVFGLLYNPILLLIAVFLWFGASGENQAEQIKNTLSNSTIGDAMLTEFHTLSPHDSLEKAIQLTLAGSQKDFPVGNEHQLQGVLTQSLLLSALQQQGQATSVGSIELSSIKTVSRDIPIQQLLERLQTDQTHMIAVSDGGKIVGIANLENVLELIKIQQALNGHNHLKA